MRHFERSFAWPFDGCEYKYRGFNITILGFLEGVVSHFPVSFRKLDRRRAIAQLS